ncbi:GNAT family N-acetyltransferase [Crocinitomicaceae bacterium]|nr:GNAT family N-acetyltransferase [Crocinitomicaceae bacterium]
MMLRELTSKKEMLENHALLLEVYPNLTFKEYENELDTMLSNNYGQVGIFNGTRCVGLTGYWIGSKLWCGKYMELDNVVVSKDYQRSGIGKKLFAYCETKAKKMNCTMLALDSYSDNFEAHKFFYAQNYIPRGFHFINVLDKSKVR